MENPFLAVFCAGFTLLDAVIGFPIEYSSVSAGRYRPMSHPLRYHMLHF